MASEGSTMSGDILVDSRNKLMVDMLGGVFKDNDGWSVLVLDDVTTRVLSALVGISDILDYGVSLVENISKKREPFPLLSGVYFISPSCPSSLDALLSDFQLATQPQYRDCHVFFSSSCPPTVVSRIKASPNLVRHLKSLKEVNLEYVMVDQRVVITDQEAALSEVFGDGLGGPAYKQAMSTCVSRLATLFATMREMPAIRYRANVPSSETVDLLPDMDMRRMVPQTVAKELYGQLLDMQKGGVLPSNETCDLIVLDRGYDSVAPIIHEWTYEAMVYDLIPEDRFKGKVFMRDVQTEKGASTRKEHALDDSDSFWLNVRHEHIASVLNTIREAFEEVKAKQAKASHGGSSANDIRNLEMSKMRKYMQNVPQFNELKSQVATHVELGSTLNQVLEAHRLRDIGKLEQDVVFGDGTGKEVTQMFQEIPQVPSDIKARLLACFLATHTERLDSESEAQWARLGGINGGDMRAIENLEYLGVPVFRRAKGLGRLRAGVQQLAGKKRRVRKDREVDEDGDVMWCRFQPLMADLLEDLVAGKLSHAEYPNIAGSGGAGGVAASPVRPGGSVMGSRGGLLGGRGAVTPTSGNATGGSVLGGRGRGGARPTWADRQSRGTVMGGEGSETSQQRIKPRKVFVFVIGGATRSEMRTAHKLSSKLNRDVFLASTSLETPASFMHKLARLGRHRFQV